jgi:hypothetical protein
VRRIPTAVIRLAYHFSSKTVSDRTMFCREAMLVYMRQHSQRMKDPAQSLKLMRATSTGASTTVADHKRTFEFSVVLSAVLAALSSYLCPIAALTPSRLLFTIGYCPAAPLLATSVLHTATCPTKNSCTTLSPSSMSGAAGIRIRSRQLGGTSSTDHLV